MYSAATESTLKKAGASPGDRVRVIASDREVEGLLLPRSSQGDDGCLVIKLGTGYNIGVEAKKVKKIEVIEKRKEQKESKPAQVKQKKGLPRISVLGCGGTIASKVDYEIGAVSPSFSPEDLLASFPELAEEAVLSGRQVLSLLSEDMTPLHWQMIARETAKEIENGADGVVLMHGTDTMHYTSAALSFMLQDLPVPVVLVGAQRSSDRGSSDNAMNLFCAVLAAKSDIAGVSVCMHGTTNDDYCLLHKGTKVRKMHTSRRNAFKSINAKPLARIEYVSKKIEHLEKDYLKRDKKRKLRLDEKVNPNVALVWVHPYLSPEMVESLSKYYDGVVLAGTGLGHVPSNPQEEKLSKSVTPAVKKLVASSVPVVMAPQTIYGRIDMNVYSAGLLAKEAGIIGDYCDWLPETAFAKLCWVLGHTKDMEKVKEMMLENIAGEISERSLIA